MSVPKDLAALLEAGAHFGHQVRRWNPKMKPYIYAVRDGVHVFDLTKTAKLLDEACAYIEEAAAKNKKILFIGTKRQAKPIVKEEANRVGAPVIIERWMGGTITNWDEISKRVKKLKDMKTRRDTGDFKQYTKMERTLLDREINRLERFFGGIADFDSIPDVLFITDVVKEKVAIAEARKMGIPVVAIVDTNCDPDGVLHPIPANDDAVRSIKYIVSRIADAFAAGKAKAQKVNVHPLYRKDEAKPAVKASENKASSTPKPVESKVVQKPVAKTAAKPVLKPVVAEKAKASVKTETAKKAPAKKTVAKKAVSKKAGSAKK